MISVTLQFSSYVEAATAMARLGGVIDPADRPDTGAPLPPIVPAMVVPAPAAPPAPAMPDPATIFGGAAAPASPPALSSAAVVPPPIAPVAPTVTSPMLPPAIVPPALPSAPAAAAPSAPVVPSNPAGVEVDTSGLPWDGRIHASTKTKTADGSWTKKRNVPPDVFVTVAAELKAALAAPPIPLPPAAPAPAPAPVAPAAPAMTAGALMQKLQEPMLSNKLTQDQLNAALQQVGLSALTQLIMREDLVPHVDAIISQHLGIAPGVPAAA